MSMSDSVRRFCNKEHFDSWQRITNTNRGDNSPRKGKVACTKATHPEWARKISENSKGRVNVGAKNAMKRPEVRARVSATRKKMFAETPSLRAELSAKVRRAWADGRFDGVRVGQCDWHDMTCANGVVIKLQGTWELKYARNLDENGIAFDAHRGKLKYVDEKGLERSYHPDFYVHSNSTYVDVKNPLYEDRHAKKIELVKQHNPKVDICVLNKAALIAMGIDI